MKKVGFFSFLILLAVFLFLFSTSRGFAATDTMDVNITIGEVSEITVVPSVLNWTDVALGAPSGNKSVTVENTGSINVTNIYVYGDALTDENVRPYGLANASNYSAASVITVNNAPAAAFYFAGRLEWNWTELIQNLNTSEVTTPVAWGFFRNNSVDYVWLVGNGSADGGGCNASDAEFYIETDKDTGVAATRQPDIEGTRDAGDADYSYFQIDSGVLDGYCVAVNTTCERIYIYKYDKRAGFTDCTNSAYLTTSKIAPGQKFQMEANAYIPRGIPAGELSRATLTFVAT